MKEKLVCVNEEFQHYFIVDDEKTTILTLIKKILSKIKCRQSAN